ncbi:hypothetical protein ASD65_12805 [Microbacterium sp. Root61]|uniref:LPXTG cell wall anchor domain-containing protein n=1 Tax=Microbacterium sp. Root61 TaxID=1736570 RepID=UPI0006F52498|nr:LPXTG cell wall anchor domain-containing protein [Microbacterium sp. Root61]KRA25204.1 hypothetical protein ASD65_12805 [Microbacterium sp. Root61]
MKKTTAALAAASLAVSLLLSTVMPASAGEVAPDTPVTDATASTAQPSQSESAEAETPDPSETGEVEEIAAAEPEPAASEAATEEPAQAVDDTRSADALDAADDLEVAEANVALWADVDLSRVTLSSGHLVAAPAGNPSAVRPTAGGSERGLFYVNGEYSLFGTPVDATAAYEIEMLGKKSGHWVEMRLYVTSGGSFASCSIFDGDPSAGGTPSTFKGFNCSAKKTQGDPNVRFTFSLSLNRWVEAAGIINTTGPIALTAGHFESDLPYHVYGSDTVAQNGTTRFESVMREGDDPFNHDTARTMFSYRVLDAGEQTTFWIVGWSANYRGGAFAWDGTCFVVDRDPQNSKSPALDKMEHADVAPYSCERTNQQWPAGNGAYEATFTVSKRQMTVVTEPFQQRELVDQVCGTTPENCGVNLATVTIDAGKPQVASDAVNNRSGSEMSIPVTISKSQTVTNSGGFKLTSKAGFDAMGGKFEVSMEYNYSRSVAATTSTSMSVPLKIPNMHRGYLVTTPPMIHTEGTVIVKKGDRYFELQGVSAEFPDATPGAMWSWDTVLDPLTSVGQPEDPAGEPLAPITPGASTTSSAGTLAATGQSSATLVGLVGAAVVLLGGGVLLIVRRRRGVRGQG